MNILLLTHSFPDNSGGWRGAFIKEQAEILSQSHNVTVVYFKNDLSGLAPFKGYSFTKSINSKFCLFTVTAYRSFPVINQVKYLYSIFRFIQNEIAPETGIDIVHSHLSYPAGFLGIFVAKKLKVPAVLTEHSWITNYFRSAIHRFCSIYAVRKSNQVITVSKTLKQNLASFCNRTIDVVPNVVDTEKFMVSSHSTGDEINIGLLGGLGTKIKGVDILFMAVSAIKNSQLIVHIGGAGKYLEDYRQLATELGIAEKVRFYGEITEQKKSEFFSRLDMYIMASRKETFGVVVIEALASGLPVISTRCGGPEEIITSENGVLIDNDNPQMLAEAISEMSGHLSSYNRQEIRTKAINEFGPAEFLKKMNAIYYRLAAERH